MWGRWFEANEDFGAEGMGWSVDCRDVDVFVVRGGGLGAWDLGCGSGAGEEIGGDGGGHARLSRGEAMELRFRHDWSVMVPPRIKLSRIATVIMTQTLENRLLVASDSSYYDPVSRIEHARNLKVSAAVGTDLLKITSLVLMFQFISPQVSHCSLFFCRSRRLKGLVKRTFNHRIAGGSMMDGHWNYWD